jgi:hypothetical protein
MILEEFFRNFLSQVEKNLAGPVSPQAARSLGPPGQPKWAKRNN